MVVQYEKKPFSENKKIMTHTAIWEEHFLGLYEVAHQVDFFVVEMINAN